MCGFVGLLRPKGPDHNPLARHETVVERMLASLAHRGPDGAGIVGEGRCLLGLARLAIIDLPAAAKPFVSEDGSVICVCNGQIYNSPELRRDLAAKGHRFATQVDTEVVLHLWEEYGPDLVHHLDGMFAFAVWDRRTETLLLGRDRAGEKPLFYWTDGHQLVFASELRALLVHPDVPHRVDPRALSDYLAQGFFRAPLSPIAGIYKLPAAHLLVAQGGNLRVSRYWDLAEYFSLPGTADRRSAPEIAEQLDERLAAAVRRRARSDVPFGVFLSGGIDSSAVLSYAIQHQGPGVPAFTLGHTDRAFDEAGFAAETARALGAELHTLILDREDLEEGLVVVGREMDEPLGDASTLPTYLLSRLARRHVKVVLSGEGADELFGGYPTYLGHLVADRVEKVPQGVLQAVIGTVRALLPVSMGNVGTDYLVQQFAAGLGRGRLARHEVWFGCIDRRALGDILSPAALAAQGEPPAWAMEPPRRSVDSLDPLAQVLYTDFTQYLQDNLLTKVDRATMLASLEARAPFLDHHLSEFVAGIPSRHKVRGRTTKAILRRTVRGRLPPAVLDRRKRGFNIPFSRWVMEGLGAQLEERFSRERVEGRGLLRYSGVRALLDDHMARRADHRKPLFALLALDLWCDRTFGEGAAVPLAEPSPAPKAAPRLSRQDLVA